ncbi:hypothetical protein CO165_04115 [Candidatus Roizmanbacteria bacterium CG_4_9_14_3_um_filter_33_18]|uniref:Bacterial Ig-like domain-containing protein n=3 Tax=Candidatus Roizmaniibacteriota TaxID=1752723 RepID=A0A2M7U8S8_9BACT|nr:MAG: hypothetical protein COW97_00720 [Candidatus Roizmanbacteria bacterium CG22_combo_CG10-13_8_21_14_all_34_12]PIZ67569.1 MAG: hypothetical protein COY12_01610 [Candidatus Roizmanbacteria bacterium CG_4_10_14_0_2_um_filter_33_96]PJA55344.1 MAG: hypothetical protein CO165_04115 [Candidatus Roizmanbacteria bacterium CG_4_9_14_3_um_filter_33_18]
MIKKILPVLLVVIILIVFSNYQKNNQTIKKMLNSKNVVTIQPTDLIKKTVNKSEKIFLQVDEPKNNITVNNAIINISGKTIANGYIFINEQELKADVNGVFASATTLEEGENYILIVASDDLGNSVEKDIMVNLETTQ